MLAPLAELLKRARLEWNQTERCVRLLKWAEAVCAVACSNVLATYVSSPVLESRIERELRATASPTFGTYVSILRIAVSLSDKLRGAPFLRFAAYETPDPPSAALRSALQVLSDRFSLSLELGRRISVLQALEAILGARNRGLGHGGVPDADVVDSVEQLCNMVTQALAGASECKLLTVEQISTHPQRVGDLLLRGVVHADGAESLWEEIRPEEDSLDLKRLYFIDRQGRVLEPPPFVQLASGSLWFLQKYRRGGRSPFTDLGATVPRMDPYWDEYLKAFYEERFERGGKVPVRVSETGVYHDLPPELEAYRKFIGREKDRELLATQLSPARRVPIVALGGVGGVGKTALARVYAQQLSVSQERARDFDYIVWVSAKTTVLKETVEEMRPGFEDIEDVLDEIARVAESPELIYAKPFERKKQEVLEILSAGRFLLVIDNFETVKRKEKFWEFLLDIPSPSKVLVTSRETFSEGCLTLQVTELGQDEALEVFGNECEALRIDRDSVLKSKKDRAELVAQTGGVPLALKHIAILLHRGVPLSDALRRLSAKVGPIADFCFRGTFEALGKPEKMVWLALGIYYRPVAAGELVQVTGLPERGVIEALEVLRRYSIVSRFVDQDGLEVFSCLPLTLEFAKKEADVWHGASEMAHRYRQYRQVIKRAGLESMESEGARAARTSGVVHPKLLARELARKARGFYREGKTEQAFELIVAAQKIDEAQPAVWEARAEVEMGEFEYRAALDSYQRLVQISPHNLSALRAIVNLSKILEEWDQAIEYARRATEAPGSTKRDWHILGMCYYRKANAERQIGNSDGKEAALLNAADCFRTALIGNPKTPRERHHNKYACHSLANTYKHLRRFEDAEAVVLEGLEFVPYDESLLDLQRQLMERRDVRGGAPPSR